MFSAATSHAASKKKPQNPEEIAKGAEIQGGTESISSCGQLQFISVTSKWVKVSNVTANAACILSQPVADIHSRIHLDSNHRFKSHIYIFFPFTCLNYVFVSISFVRITKAAWRRKQINKNNVSFLGKTQIMLCAVSMSLQMWNFVSNEELWQNFIWQVFVHQ